jgi:hypothetical protein
MNKKILLTILISLTLTACSYNFGTSSSTPIGAPSADELPAQTKLILGAINLKSENAITAQQAKVLLPMFYVLRDLNESDTAAQEEINGLVSQIQETLTPVQIQAIEAMSLTRQDMFAIIQGGNGGTGITETTATTDRNEMGGPPEMGGGMPSGGIPGGGMSGTGTSTTSENNDESARPAMDTSTPSALFDTIIKLLEKKVTQ